MTLAPGTVGELTWSSTALVVVDAMPRLLAMPLAPLTGPVLLRRCGELAEFVRRRRAVVVLVHTERPQRQPPGSGLAPGLARAGDLVLVKQSIGAFATTRLHDELSARSVRTVLVAGVATNLGVESTARGALDLGYQVAFAADAMSAFSDEEHEATLKYDVPHLGALVTSSPTAGTHPTSARNASREAP